jgi:hypothetical protein
MILVRNIGKPRREYLLYGAIWDFQGLATRFILKNGTILKEVSPANYELFCRFPGTFNEDE